MVVLSPRAWGARLTFGDSCRRYVGRSFHRLSEEHIFERLRDRKIKADDLYELKP